MKEFLRELSVLFSEIFHTLAGEIKQLDTQTQLVLSAGLVLLILFLIFADTSKKPSAKAAPKGTQGDICISVAADSSAELDGLLHSEIEKQKACLAVADKSIGGVNIGEKKNADGVWKQEAHITWKNK